MTASGTACSVPGGALADLPVARGNPVRNKPETDALPIRPDADSSTRRPPVGRPFECQLRHLAGDELTTTRAVGGSLRTAQVSAPHELLPPPRSHAAKISAADGRDKRAALEPAT